MATFQISSYILLPEVQQTIKKLTATEYMDSEKVGKPAIQLE
jgi:hypothetical protein